MCGIIGHIEKTEIPEHVKTWFLVGLAGIRHRGPDHEGIYEDPKLLLGHRRLSIIDPSTMGNQPLKDDKGNVLIFNGEIYNFKELAVKHLKTKSILSDSVVLFELLTHYPIQEILPQLDGMFAFSFLDAPNETVHFATDPLGIKSGYYMQEENSFSFCSEISPLINHPNCSKKINHEAFTEQLSTHTNFGSHTLVEGIIRFKPGTYYQLSLKDLKLTEEKFDNLTSRKHTETSLKETVINAVEKRLVSDVPLGLLLSGGVDSNIINVIIQKELNKKVDTFSLIFEDKSNNELDQIQLVQKIFNHNHYNLMVKAQDIAEESFNFLFNIDYPSSDGLNTYLVSKAIHDKGIRVALSGLGGDEVFSGYPSFRWNQLIQRHKWISKIPHPFRKKIGGFIFHYNDELKNYKLQETLKTHAWEIPQYYPLTRILRTPNQNKSIQKALGVAPSYHFNLQFNDEFPSDWGDNSKWSLMELKHYTRAILLRDADQMSMKHQIELRVPFLDRQLVSKVLFDNQNTINPEQNKWELVKLFATHFPENFFSQPKTGFDLPLKDYLEGPLEQIKLETLKDFGLNIYKEKPINQWHLLVLMHWIKRHGLQL